MYMFHIDAMLDKFIFSLFGPLGYTRQPATWQHVAALTSVSAFLVTNT